MEEKTTYQTLTKSSIGLYKDKGSKFHSYAFHVSSLQEVNDRLAEVKKAHHSARHHCYAYRLHPDGSLYRANDDGEPSHSAGDPILGQIDSVNLTEVLIVVVRYFGGVKLGVGGLINAYRSAARDAIEENEIQTVVMRCRYSVHFSYARMNEVMRILKNTQADMIEHDFAITCQLIAEVNLEKRSSFEQSWIDLHDVQIERLN